MQKITSMQDEFCSIRTFKVNFIHTGSKFETLFPSFNDLNLQDQCDYSLKRYLSYTTEKEISTWIKNQRKMAPSMNNKNIHVVNRKINR